MNDGSWLVLSQYYFVWWLCHCWKIYWISSVWSYYELLHAIHRFERVFGNRKSTLSKFDWVYWTWSRSDRGSAFGTLYFKAGTEFRSRVRLQAPVGNLSGYFSRLSQPEFRRIRDIDKASGENLEKIQEKISEFSQEFELSNSFDAATVQQHSGPFLGGGRPPRARAGSQMAGALRSSPLP